MLCSSQWSGGSGAWLRRRRVTCAYGEGVWGSLGRGLLRGGQVQGAVTVRPASSLSWYEGVRRRLGDDAGGAAAVSRGAKVGAVVVGLLYLTVGDLYSKTVHALNGTYRFLRSGLQVGIVALDYKLSLAHLEGDALEVKKHQVHLRSAQRMLDLFLANGGIFIKAGQHVASMQHVLPFEYTTTMKACQDKAQCRPFEEVRQLVEREIGCPLEDKFSSFEEEPFAAASLAQVHRATLRRGGQRQEEQVAVKVQYPGLEKEVSVDVMTITFLLSMVERFFPEFEFGWLVREFENNLPMELNFVGEGQNAERMNRIFLRNNRVFAPRVFWDVTTKRVLVMEMVNGCKVNDLARLQEMGVDAAEVSELLTQVFSEMIFIQGFFHADPHPGNIMIRKARSGVHRFEMIVLDHGLYRTLTDDFRLNYCRLWKALLLRDEDNIRKYCQLLGAGESTYKVLITMLTSRDQSRADFAMGNELTHDEVALLREYGSQFFGKIMEVLANVPQQMLLLFKCKFCEKVVPVSSLMDLRLPVNYFLSMGRSAQRGITQFEDHRDPSIGGWISHHWAAFCFRFRLWFYGVVVWFSSLWSFLFHSRHSAHNSKASHARQNATGAEQGDAPQMNDGGQHGRQQQQQGGGRRWIDSYHEQASQVAEARA